MVNKWSRTKFTNPGERDYELRLSALKDLERSNREADAYSKVARPNHVAPPNQVAPPAPEVYRNLNGHQFKVVYTEMGRTTENVSAEEQNLDPGFVWLPVEPKGSEGPYNAWYEFGQSMFDYTQVKPTFIGYNEFDAADGSVKIRQPKEVKLSEYSFLGKMFEGVSTTVFDPAREYFTMSSDGTTQLHPALNPAPAPAPPVVATPAPAPTPQQQYAMFFGDYDSRTFEELTAIPQREPDMAFPLFTEEELEAIQLPKFDMTSSLPTPPESSSGSGDLDYMFRGNISTNSPGPSTFDAHAGYAPAQRYRAN